MNVDLLRPNTVPIAPETVLWFEFLLDPNLLEKHLLKPNPDPSPLELIVKFLSITPETYENKPLGNDVSLSIKSQTAGILKKHYALKILSLKTAAYLKWNLKILESELPIEKQAQLLKDLLCVCIGQDLPVPLHPNYIEVNKPIDPGDDTPLQIDEDATDLSDLMSKLQTDIARFATTLYHRWVLRVQVHRGLQPRHNKISYFHVPGLQENNLNQFTAMEEAFVSDLNQYSEYSIAYLNNLSQRTQTPFKCLSYDSFVSLSETTEHVEQTFEGGFSISLTELRTQIHFDMAMYYLFVKKYEEARKHVLICKENFEKLCEEYEFKGNGGTETFRYCSVSRDDMEGYYEACFGAKGGLFQQMNASALNHYMGIIGILEADNISREIPLLHRRLLELDIKGTAASGAFTVARDLIYKVEVLNYVRSVLDDDVAVIEQDFLQRLQNGGSKAIGILISAFKAVLPKTTEKQKEHIDYFILQLKSKAVGCDLSKHLSELNIEEPDDEKMVAYGEIDIDFDMPYSEFIGSFPFQNQATHISKMDPDFVHVWTKNVSLLTMVKSLPTRCESPLERFCADRSSGDSHLVGNEFTIVSKDTFFVQTCTKLGSIFDICVAWSGLMHPGPSIVCIFVIVDPKTDQDVSDLEMRRKRMEAGLLEGKLVHCMTADGIRQLLVQLVGTNPTEPLWKVNKEWVIPIPLQSVVMSLPTGFLQDFSYILLAKSKQLVNLKIVTHSETWASTENETCGTHNFNGKMMRRGRFILCGRPGFRMSHYLQFPNQTIYQGQDYSSALSLLNVLERKIQEAREANHPMVIKLGRLISWEILLVQCTQLLDEWPSRNIDTQNLGLKCRQCLASLQSGDSIIPRIEILEHAATVLLNLGDWDVLAGLERQYGSLELCSAVAHAANDLTKFKGNKKLHRDTWDLVLPMFGSGPLKRNSSGNMVHRDSPTSNYRENLFAFLMRLKESTVLSLIISLLARLHNVLKDESNTELNVEYTVLWPAMVTNANSYNPRTVSETLRLVLSEALKIYPDNVPWIKLQGDLDYNNGFYESAMSKYVEAIVVGSEYLSLPQTLTKPLIDDVLIRRMIKTCSQLGCHAQAAVLCQFLEETDYGLAFKSLSEKSNSFDAMDAYYCFVWEPALLEYIVSMHHKRGENKRRQQAISLMGLLELNSNNNEEIQREAAALRKAQFIRALDRQYRQ